MKHKNAKYKRPSWDETFIDVMRVFSRRATCDRGRSAALIVKNKRIISTGYVGSPPGLEHCDEAGHLMEKRYNADGTVSEHCIRTTHAEMNALAQAARYGVSVEGATLYCRMTPCRDCAKMLISAGIKKVIAQRKYHQGSLTEKWFKQAGVEFVALHDETLEYERQTLK